MSSILSSSFSWGFDPNFEQVAAPDSKQPREVADSAALSPERLLQLQASLSQSQKSKRRLQDDDELTGTSPSPSQKRVIKRMDKFRIAKKEVSHKRVKQVQTIIGQPLPTQRIVEVLDKKNLQSLLNNLISRHPEIASDVYLCSPKATVKNSIEILTQKSDAIIAALPYKVDPTSEYSYLRVKPLIEDFLNALSDYTLNFLPPVEALPANSLDFLDSATTLLHKLPEFEQLSNNYFKNLAYEQLSHTWCMCLKEFIKSTSSTNSSHASLLLLINNNWESKLKKHNEMSNNRLNSVVEFFKGEVNWLSDEFESEHAKFNNLKNFSIHNSPLHGTLLNGKDIEF